MRDTRQTDNDTTRKTIGGEPRLSPVVYLLFALVGAGLLALGLAAFTAFHQVAGWVQALAAAVLIEAGMVLETMALIRGNRWSIPGVAVSLIVSGTYNYIQAQQAGRIHGLTDWWQLGTLAIGPLAALFSLALAIGYELRKHEAARLAWTAAQEKERSQTQARIHEERAQARAEEQRAREQAALLEARKAIEIEKIQSEERRQLEVARLAAEERAARRLTKSLPMAVHDSDTRVSRGGGLAEFLTVARANGGMTAAQIQERYGVSERTAWRWIAKARGGQDGTN